VVLLLYCIRLPRAAAACCCRVLRVSELSEMEHRAADHARPWIWSLRPCRGAGACCCTRRMSGCEWNEEAGCVKREDAGETWAAIPRGYRAEPRCPKPDSTWSQRWKRTGTISPSHPSASPLNALCVSSGLQSGRRPMNDVTAESFPVPCRQSRLRKPAKSPNTGGLEGQLYIVQNELSIRESGRLGPPDPGAAPGESPLENLSGLADQSPRLSSQRFRRLLTLHQTVGCRAP
jgi:hypothetical protein